MRAPILVLPERARQVAAADERRLLVRELADPATLQNRAEALRTQGRYEEAVAAYRSVLAVDPHYAPAHAGMGHALFALERYREALESLARAASWQPDAAIAGSLQRLMGRAAQELDRHDAAAEHYRRAVEIDPRDTAAIDRLAALRFAQQRYGAALDRYRALLAIQPDDAQTHANLGATLYYLGRTGDAIRSFERALSLDPALEAARSALDRLREIARPDGPGRDGPGRDEPE